MITSITGAATQGFAVGGAPASSSAANGRLGSSESQIGREEGFGAVFERLALESFDTLKNGEAAAISGVRGTMATQEVVGAVIAAEHALQTAIAVRDKVVSAYLEISRMAI